MRESRSATAFSDDLDTLISFICEESLEAREDGVDWLEHAEVLIFSDLSLHLIVEFVHSLGSKDYGEIQS